MTLSTSLSSDRFDTLIVGAGFAGSVLAERLASQCGQRVGVIDRRDHVAGNAHDYVDKHGVVCHRYGPHVFHTSAERVWRYLSQFTSWRPYEHRVLAQVDGQLLPFPINRETVNRLYGLSLTSDQDMRSFLASREERRHPIETSEDVVVSACGRELYEKFFRGYTRKQWRADPAELEASVCARIPVRLSEDNRYFSDSFQYMPRDGYAAMFKRMLSHPNIEVGLSLDFDEVRDKVHYGHLVYTGPLDRFYSRRFGELPYRSVHFELENHWTDDQALVQQAPQVNYPAEDVPYTRTTEYRHLTGQTHNSSTIAVEYPTDDGEPCYPIPRNKNRQLYNRYRQLAAAEPHVTFVGRLARYQYLNMDQVVGQALSTFERMRRSAAPTSGSATG